MVLKKRKKSLLDRALPKPILVNFGTPFTKARIKSIMEEKLFTGTPFTEAKIRAIKKRRKLIF